MEKVYIGVTVSASYGQRGSQNVQGVTVKSVTEGSPAEEAGIKEGDIITAVNGEKITSASGLSAWTSKSKAGDVLTLSIIRDGENIELKVTLGVRQQTTAPEDNEDDQDQDYPDESRDGNSGWESPYGRR